MDFDSLSNKVIGAALKVHSELGPGLFEEVYKVCLKYEIGKSGLKVLSEVGIPVIYDGTTLDLGYRADLIVEDSLIVELKSGADFAPLHSAQLLTYLRLAHKDVGLLFNFNTAHLRDGILRMINSPLRSFDPSR